ncbi:MAG: hypothetical protein ABJZ55_25145 [Fuerstiella sp.]
MKNFLLALLGVCTALHASPAFSHFIWLSPARTDSGGKVRVFFGEEAGDDSSDYLSRVSGVVVSKITGNAAPDTLPLNKTSTSISTSVDFNEQCLYVTSHDLGIMDRGDSKFRLMYYAKTGPVAGSTAWQTAKTQDDLKLDVVPSFSNGKIKVAVYFNQKAAAGVQVKATRPGADDVEVETDAKGQASFHLADTGLYSIRARHVDNKPGQVQGEEYPETRSYCTVSLMVPTADSPAETAGLQNLPQPVTSFGAAVSGQSLFMYGGHSGSAHSYSMEEQSNELTRLDLNNGQWKTVAHGPHLQGLALVGHQNKLYRIGGFTAMNDEGEEHNLVSQNTVACFDQAKGVWTELPALPERRSSHDAAVVGDVIYVVGGWAMGAEEKQWHSTAWKLDLNKAPLHWQPIASPGFERRALAAAAHGGKLYVVGGMQKKGGPTTQVAAYDPQTDKWSDAASLFVKPTPKSEEGQEGAGRNMSSGAMTGFGASAFATGGSLYVTTVQGDLQRLSDDGSQWEVVRDDLTPRFFHRLLPLSKDRLIVVGGSNMSIGKFEEVEVIDVAEGS